MICSGRGKGVFYRQINPSINIKGLVQQFHRIIHIPNAINSCDIKY